VNNPPFAMVEVDAVDCGFEPVPWRFADDRRHEIDAHWEALVAARPQLFNGRVLLLHRGGVETTQAGRRVFRGAYMEVEFKAFLAWRDFGYPVLGPRNGFAMAALRGADGSFLLGEMGAHTANAGRIYFPSGTPDREDIVDGRVDIEGSARRELAEETGLDLDGLVFEPGFTLIHDDVRVCCMKPVRSPETCDALLERIHANLAREAQPELARMHIVRGEADITPQMPFFVTAYMRRAFAADT
jgi:8-oxo-dGTP pyrophosphatase MutT (NUDIX family)